MNDNRDRFRNIISNKDSHFKIKIEDISEFNNSFFKDVYEEATKNLQDIINNNLDYYYEKDKSKDNSKFKYMDKEEKNNIIAFAGERGAGKTSAMVSFAGALSSDSKEVFEPMSNLSDKKFWVLNSIDPSLFEENESIFQVVIAKLFEEFRREIENDSNKINEQSEIIRTFEKVYKNFKVISSGAKYNDNISLDDTLEALSNLAASSSMRENFMQLVKLLLEYKYGKDMLKNSYLVLSIDDLDMNINKSSDMAEQIRKYLLIPNVIILMAVKVEQLKDSIEQMFRKEYEIMSKNNIELEDDPKNMAARYIEKLIPNGRKVYLPNFKLGDNLDNVKIEIKDNNNKVLESIRGVQECVLGMIYKKTGLIFVKPNEGVHLLIPDNMRELQNLLATLTNLKDIEFYVNKERCKGQSFVGIQEKDKKNLTKNVEVFEQYFYTTWIRRNLDSKDINIIEEFRLKPVEYKNKFIINKLAEKKILENEKSQISQIGRDDFGDYVEIKNKSYNMSLGDVLDVLDINKDYDSENMQKLKFAIKTVYSLEIHKRLYFKEYNNKNDEMYIDNFNLIEFMNRREILDYSELDNNLQLKLACSKGINDIYKLTAGNILGKIYGELTRRSRSSQERAVWKINDYNKMPIVVKYENKTLKFGLDALIKFLHTSISDEKRIEKLLEEMIDINSFDKKEKSDVKKFIEEDITEFEFKCKNAIRLVHNFIYQGHDLKEEKNYRINEDKYYDIKVNLTTGFAHKSSVFSVYALLTKALNINSVYESLINLRNKRLKINNIEIIEEMIEDIDKNCSYILLPLNSIEALEYIKEYLYKYRSKYFGNKYISEENQYFESIVKTSYILMYDSIISLEKHMDYIGNNKLFSEQFKSFSLIKYLLKNKNINQYQLIEFENMSKNIDLVRKYSEDLEKIDGEKSLIEELIKNLEKCKTQIKKGKVPSYGTLRKKWIQFTSLLQSNDQLKAYSNNSKLIKTLYESINENGKDNIVILRQNEQLRSDFYYKFENTLDKIIEDFNVKLNNIKNIGE
ncbi:Uncharacterised protein [[Clostridium] sordellii]|uniref:hypothetical protein n=1 Tax=Paraclostridium sordellii TaxID=1505 RepID=UPI0005E3CB87|nr:hypothetical protein [Paeniclostridium sordellii]CEN75144.1 Uncharacterised protein [[Clostridium] sordellii] [Paeniclostridium sordellii]